MSFTNYPFRPTYLPIARRFLLSLSPSALVPHRIPIPSVFYSTDTEAPFEKCLVCERALLDGTTDYVIEKGYRTFDAYDVRETVFGYALCMRCHAAISQSFSETSKHRCQSYLQQHVNLRERSSALLDHGSDETNIDPSRWIDHCIVHETPRDELGEYQLLAHCHKEDLLLTHLPLMIGGRAVEELVQRLSNETLDELGGFRDEYFGLPPELKHNLQGPVLV